MKMHRPHALCQDHQILQEYLQVEGDLIRLYAPCVQNSVFRGMQSTAPAALASILRSHFLGPHHLTKSTQHVRSLEHSLPVNIDDQIH